MSEKPFTEEEIAAVKGSIDHDLRQGLRGAWVVQTARLIAAYEDRLACANLECEQSMQTIAGLREALEEAEDALADVTLMAVSEKYGMRMMWELIGGEAYEWPDHAPKTVHAAIGRAVKHLRASRARAALQWRER